MIEASNSVMTAWGADEPLHSLKELPAKGFNRLWTVVRHGRKLLLKGLREEYRDNPHYLALLRKEFELGMKLDHPGVVRVWDLEHHQLTGQCIVMEYVEGCTLDRYLHRAGVGRSERLRLATELAEVLGYVHSAGVSHRDLKPDNVMVTNRGAHIKLLDFGLSDSDDFTIMKSSAATLTYGAPEQTAGGYGDERSDVWAFGVIMKEMRLGMAYSGIVRSCMLRDPKKRPGMDEVARRISRRRESMKRLPAIGLTLTVLAVLAVVAIRPRQVTEAVNPLSQDEDSALDTVRRVEVVHDTVRVAVVPGENEAVKVPADEAEPQKPADAAGSRYVATHPLADSFYEESCKRIDDIISRYSSRTDASNPVMERQSAYMESYELMKKEVAAMTQKMRAAGVGDPQIDQYETALWYRVSKLQAPTQ